MDLYHTTDVQGITELNPTTEKMRALLNSLDEDEAKEAEHPDVTLVHDPSAWSLAVYPSGIVTLENLDDADHLPRFMTDVTRNQALKLWLELSRGQIQQVNSHPWLRDETGPKS
jgi:hypothetical protein